MRDVAGDTHGGNETRAGAWWSITLSADDLLGAAGASKRTHPAARPGQWVWTDEDEGRWLVTPTIAAVAGRWDVVGLEVRSCRLEGEDHLEHVLPTRRGRLDDADAEEAIPLTARSWRAMGGLIRETRRRHEEALEEATGALERERADERRQGRRAKARAGLEAVADLYLGHVRRGGTTPRRAVADALDISPSTAGQRIHRARAAGLLPETTPGRIPDVD